MKKQNLISYVLIAFFTIIYLLFPTANSSSDAYGYASYPVIGPHHFLYDFIATGCINISNDPVSSLAYLKIINALFAGLILFIADLFLQKIKTHNRWVWLIFIGSAFGFMRFATENETYIIPIFFSLLGTYFLLFSEYTYNFPRLIMAFACFGIAILFHQIHLMWFLAASLALVIRKGFHLRILLIPVSMLVFVLGYYYLYVIIDAQNLIDFLTGDLGSETVQLKPGLDNFKFTAINFIRSFFQIHGNIQLLWQSFFIEKVLLSAGIILLVIAGCIKIIKLKKLQKTANYHAFGFTRLTLILAFVFHVLFAWYSVGNAEFMAMIPLLVALIVCISYAIDTRVVLFAGAGMFIWNMSSALIPSKHLNYENLEAQSQVFYTLKGHLISQNKIALENYIRFQKFDVRADTSINPYFHLPIHKAPADMDKKEWPVLQNDIADLLKDSIPVYTDCINYPLPASRKSMLNADKNTEFFKQYNLELCDSVSCFYGKIKYYRLLNRR